MNLTHRRPYRPTPDERRALRKNRGVPTCPNCEAEDVDSAMPKLAMTDGEEIGPNYRTVLRTCPTCNKTWNVEFRVDGDRPRVVGYSASFETTEEEGDETMSKKSKATKAAAPKGREHTTSEGVKAMKAAKKRATIPDETPVEPKIDADPIHAPVTGARPTPKPPRDEAALERADDSCELVVFAFRLSRAERDLIHTAAGSAKASKFVRGLAVAAALGDGEALQKIIDECRPVTP